MDSDPWDTYSTPADAPNPQQTSSAPPPPAPQAGSDDPWNVYGKPQAQPSTASPAGTTGQQPSWMPDWMANATNAVERGVSSFVGAPRALADVNAAQKPTLKAEEANWGIQPNKTLPMPLGMEHPFNTPSAADTQNYIVHHGGVDYTPKTMWGRLGNTALATGVGGFLGGPEGVAAGLTAGGASQLAAEFGLPPAVQQAIGIGASFFGHSPSASAATEKGLAARGLAEVSANPDAPIGQPPIPGVPRTLGQATNDPGLLSFEKSRFNKPENAGAYQDIIKAQNQAAINAMRNTPGLNVPNEGQGVIQTQAASGSMHENLQDAMAAAKANERATWKAVDPGRTTSFPTAPMINDLANYEQETGVRFAPFVPKRIVNMVNSLGDYEPLDQLQAVRSAMTTEKASLQRAGDYNAANVVGGMADRWGNQIDNLNMPDPDMLGRYNLARAATRDYHSLFDASSVQKAVKGDPTQAVNRVIGSGRPEDLDNYINATGGTPEAMQAVRDAFMGKLASASEQVGKEGQFYSAANFKKFLNNNRAILSDNRVFTDDQRDVINRGSEMLDYSQRPQRAGMSGVSPTYQLLSGEKYAELFLGKLGAGVLKQALHLGAMGGAAIGSIGGHFGAAFGAGLGERLGNALSFKNAGQRVMGYMDQAIKDPEFASEIRQYINSPSATTLTPKVKAAFAPLLVSTQPSGVSEGAPSP